MGRNSLAKESGWKGEYCMFKQLNKVYFIQDIGPERRKGKKRG